MVSAALAPLVRISTVSAPAPVVSAPTVRSSAEVTNTSPFAVACSALPPLKARPKALAVLTPIAPPAFNTRSLALALVSTAPAVSRIAPVSVLINWEPAALKVLAPLPWKMMLRAACRELLVVRLSAMIRSSPALCTSRSPLALMAVAPPTVRLPLAPALLVNPTVDKVPPSASMVCATVPTRVPAPDSVTSLLAVSEPAKVKALLTVRLPALTSTEPLISMAVAPARVRLPVESLVRSSTVRLPVPSVPALKVWLPVPVAAMTTVMPLTSMSSTADKDPSPRSSVPLPPPRDPIASLWSFTSKVAPAAMLTALALPMPVPEPSCRVPAAMSVAPA